MSAVNAPLPPTPSGERRAEVARLRLEGFTTAEIAAELDLPAGTVSYDLRALVAEGKVPAGKVPGRAPTETPADRARRECEAQGVPFIASAEQHRQVARILRRDVRQAS